MVENLIIQSGFNAVEPLVSFLKKLSPEDPLRKLAATRMLSLILVQELRNTKKAGSEGEQKRIVLQMTTALGEMAEEHLSTRTSAEIFGHLEALSEILVDQKVWEELEKLDEKIERPKRWQGEEPAYNELELPLPQDSVFIASFLRRIDTPFGPLLRGYHFSDLSAEEIVEHFEKRTGKRAIENSFKQGQIETSFTIKCWPAPKEVDVFLEPGVTVFKAQNIFEERAFGQVLNTGRTMFRITKLQYYFDQTVKRGNLREGKIGKGPRIAPRAR